MVSPVFARLAHCCSCPALALAALLAVPANGQNTYAFEELPTLGGDQGLALGLNDFGDIVGEAQLADGRLHATLWSGGHAVDLGTLGGDASVAYDLNSAGRIVGRATITPGPFGSAAAFRLDPGDSGLTALQNLPDFFNGLARAVNEAGLVAGFSGGFDITSAVRWTESGAVAALPPLPSVSTEPFSDVWDSNDLGDFVGQSTRTDFGTGFIGFGAALWRKGVATPEFLGTLGGSGSFARAINDSRQVVGFASLPSGQGHAFLWESGVMTDLGDLAPPGQEVLSIAQDINEAGVVVGRSIAAASDFRAFVWNGSLHDLNDLAQLPAGWVLEQASAINVHGQIVGEGRTPTGETRGFLLTPTGVPAALPMVATPASLSLASGGVQSFLVKGGLANAGNFYIVLGSASGTTPGLPLAPGVVLPLVFDAYTSFSINKVNKAPFGDTFGVLDGTGRAAASFTLPAQSDPGLAGVELNHAFAVFDAVTVEALYAGNAASLTFVP